MKNIIDRYLYDVSRRLPENMRADVERELRSNIEDMLSDSPSDDEIEKVLTGLGSPVKLAVQYNPHPRYLISPELFDDYISVLKVVAVTLAAILAAVGVFKLIFASEIGTGVAETVAQVLASFIGGAVTGLLHAFFWVTLSFGIFEYVAVKKNKDVWQLKNLPEIPTHSSMVIKRSDSIANAFFSILFTTIFLVGTLRDPAFIAWYEAGQPSVQLFNADIVRQFLPLFIFVMAFTLFLAVMKTVTGRWTVSVAVLQILYSIFSAVIGIAFISRPEFLNTAFLTRFAEKLSIQLSALQEYIRISIIVLTVLIIIGAISEIIPAIVKTAKGYNVKYEI